MNPHLVSNDSSDPHPDRRRALAVFGGAGLAVVAAACSPDTKEVQGSTTTTTTTPTSAGGSPSTTVNSVVGSATSATSATSAVPPGGTCAVIPQETAGPYPADGSNGVEILTQNGVVRRDIRSSFGSSTTTAAGVPLTVQLDIVTAASGCAPSAGAAVYIWHCDREGRYSMYSQGVTGENYLRGVQAAGTDGRVTFTTAFPGAYSGRWPHIHFEVYPDVGSITNARNAIATSQLALPQDVCQTVYGTAGYGQSASNLSRTSLAGDMVFRDGASQETPTVTGSITDGYVATLTVPV